MKKTVVGLFNNKQSAEDATYQLRKQGFNMDNVSIVARDSDNRTYTETNTDRDEFVNDNISDGVTAGSVLGGLAGLLIGAGTFAVPGLGVIAAAGPIAGLISGAVTGGVVGGLVDLGIPEEESREYETNVKSGKVLLSVTADDNNVDQITKIINTYGATQVNIY